MDKAAAIAVSTVKDWMDANTDYRMEVTFCCFDEGSMAIYKDLLQ